MVSVAVFCYNPDEDNNMDLISGRKIYIYCYLCKVLFNSLLSVSYTKLDAQLKLAICFGYRPNALKETEWNYSLLYKLK